MALLLRWKVVFFIFFIQYGVKAQEQFVNQALTPDNTEQFMELVYGLDWMVKNPDAVAALKKCMNERISYVQSPLTTNDKFPTLSSFPLMNKNNASIVAIDYLAFNPSTFIPLTYSLPFFSNKTEIIRVDGTEYLIVIEPQHKNEL